ncbi:hypothetical protein [Paenibacillus koleovorans]|uniref:hypothetical protein n=1 Tax=Paenibacillus koleovorans TaxID=121608 RepID=UPI000FD6D006|nr:hypothetical protein [Paenibacillus koleovorans]
MKLGKDLYYKGYDEEKIKTANDAEWASRIANEKFALDVIGFLQNFFDAKGKKRPESAGKVIPPLVGLAEAAEILGWDKRKVSTYIQRGSFPAPLSQLASGPIWTYKQIEDYRDGRK